ncbi:MAG: hypothetical protein MJ245_01425 [Clostridia bacterium]|nr:hypothetical protein [Clostridia bacterium]
MFKRFLVSLLIVSTIFTSVPTTAFAAADISPDETIEQTQEAEEDVASEDAGDENTDENIGGSTETQSQEAIVTEAIHSENPEITATVSEQSPSENIATPTEEVKEDEGTTPSEETGEKKDDETLANVNVDETNNAPEETPVAVEKPVMMMSSSGLYGASYARIQIKNSDDGNAKWIKEIYNLKVGTEYTVEEFVSIRYTVVDGYEITGATITYDDGTPTKTLGINDSFTIDKKFIFKPITQAKSNKCTITFANATGVTANTESIQVDKGESILVSDLLDKYYTISEDYKVTSANVKKDGNSNVKYNVTESFTADANKITLTPSSSKRDKYQVSIYLLSGEHGHYKDSNVTSYYVYDSNIFTVTTDKVAEFVEPDDGYKLVGFEVGIDNTLYTSKQVTVYSTYYSTYIYPVFELDGVRNLTIDFNGGTNAAGETSHTYEINRTDSFYFATNSDYIKDVTRTGYKVSSYTINGEKYTGIKEIKAGKDDVKITLNWSELPKNTYTIKLQGANNDKLSFKDSNDTAFYVYQGNKLTIDVDALNSKLNVEKGYEIYGFQLDSLSTTYLYSKECLYKYNNNHNVYPLVREAVTDVNFRDCESITGKVTPGAKLDLHKGDEITLNKEFANAHFTMKDNGYEIIGFEVYNNINVGPVSTVNDLNANTKLTLTADHYYVYPLLQEKTYNITIHLEGATVDGKDTYVIPNQGANTNFTLTTDNVNNLSNYVAKPNAELAGFYTGTDSNVKTSLTFKNLTSDVDVYLKWDDVRIIKDFVTKSIPFDGKGHNWTEFVEDDSLNQITDLAYSAMAFDGNDATNLVEPGTYKILVACASSNVKFAFENPYVKDGVPQKTSYVFEVTIEAPKTHQVIVDYNGGVNPQGDTSSKYTVNTGSNFTKSIDDYDFVEYEGYKLVGFEVDGATVDKLDITVNADTNVKLVWAKTYTITVNVSNYRGNGYQGQPKFTEEVAEGDTFTFDYSTLDIAKYYAIHSVKVDGSWQWSDLEKQFKLDGVNKDYTVDITISPKDYHILLKKADGNKDLIVSGTGYYDRSFDDSDTLVSLVNEKIKFKDHYSLDVLTCDDDDDVTGLTISELIMNYEADDDDIITVYVSAKEDPKRTITVDYNGGLNPQNETSSEYIEYVGVNFERTVNDYNFVKYEGYELVGFEVDGKTYETLSFKVKEDTSVKLIWERITNQVVINLPDHVTYNGENQIIEYVPYGESFTFDYGDLTIDTCYELTGLYIMGSQVDLGDKIYIDSVKEAIIVGLDAEPIKYTIEFVGGDDHCHGKTVNSFIATIDKDNGDHLDEDLISRYIDCDEHFFINDLIVTWNELNYSGDLINKMLMEAYEDNLTTLTIKVYTLEEDKYPVTIYSLDTYSQNKTYESYYNDKFTFPDKSDLGFSNPRELKYFDDGSGNKYHTGDKITVDGGLNFDCIWEPFEYSIEIDYNGGIAQYNGDTSGSNTYIEEEPIYIVPNDFLGIFKEGYHIKGFEKVNDDGTTSYVGDVISYPMGLTSDVKYNIVWEIDTHDLNIHLVGATFNGSSDISRINVEYGTTLTFPKKLFEGTEGKVLTVVEIDGENVYASDFDVYADDFVFKNITEDTDVLLVWEYFDYVVRFVPEENCKLINSDVDFYYFTIEDIVSISESDIEEYIESNDDRFYEFDHFEIDGQSYQAISWPNLTSDVTVKVYYKPIICKIFIGTDKGCIINDSTTTTVGDVPYNAGSDVTIDADFISKYVDYIDGYQLDYFEVDGTRYEADETFVKKEANCNISVNVHTYKNYTATFETNDGCEFKDGFNGTVTDKNTNPLTISSSYLASIIEGKDDTYEFAYFMVDGDDTKYSANDKIDITEDTTIKVFYDQKMVTVTYESDDATVKVPTNDLVWGSEYTIDVTDIEKHITTPDGYELSYFEINGEKYGSNESMYYPSLEDDLTVKAYYEKKDATITYTCTLPDSLTINDTATYGSKYSIDSDKILEFYTLPEGFYIDYFEVDGVKYEADKVCTIDDINKDKYNVHVVVDTYKYTITYVPEENCKLLDEAYNSQKWSFGNTITIDNDKEIQYIVGPLNENCEYAYFTINDDPTPRTTYTTSGKLEDVTVHVYYTRKQCEVSYTCTNGSVIDGGKVTIPMGDNYTVDANEIAKYTKANDGCKFDSFEVDGVTYKANESCEIKNIKEAKEVIVNFVPVFTIKFVAEDNCKLIDSSKDEIVALRSEQVYVNKSLIDEFIVGNDDTYVLDYFTLDDGTYHYDSTTSIGFTGYYAKDVNTIHVYYKKLAYDVNFRNDGNASLKSGANAKTTYEVGFKVVINRDSIEEIFEPVEGYKLDSFTVNGTKYELDETFTLDSIDSNVEVVANYAKITFTITIDLNGGVDPDNTVTLVNTVEYGDKFVTPNLTKVVKEHFEITEVVVTDSKGNVVTDQPAAFEAVKDNYNAKLIWTQNEFVITIDPGDHGKLNSSATNNYYSYYLSTSIQSLSYNIDVEEGWYIDYFTLNDDTSIKYEYYWEETTEDVVVHVHYSQIMETITLKANNGIDTDKTFDVPYGDYTVPKCDFKAPSGKEFDYWKVEIKGIPLRPLLGSGINPVDGMKVKPGDVIFVKGNVTLVAIYKDKPNDPKPDDPKPNDPTPNDPTPNGPTPNGNTPNGNVPTNGGIISWILPQTGGVDVSWYAVIIPAVSLIAIGSALLAFLKKKSNKEQN